MQVKKQQLEPDMEQQTIRQGCILSPCLLNLYAEYIIRNARLYEAQAGEMPITSDMPMTPPLREKAKTKEPLDESKRGE